MSRCDSSDRIDSGPCEVVTAIRTAVGGLDGLDAATAGFLNALAFILMRVADVDREVTDDERLEMEGTLRRHALLSPAEAVLVVEIARHRARLADCGCRYDQSRWLRSELDDDRRGRVLECLYAVAAADGSTTTTENDAIVQIAHELGFASADLAGRH